jgi:hypothetical protein
MRSTRVARLGACSAALAVLFGAGIVACGGDSDSEVRTQGTASSTTDPTSTGSTGGSSGTASCTLPGANTDAKTSSGSAGVGLLTDVRVGTQPCADRVVFDFRAEGPGYSFQYEPGPFTFGESGQPITIDGSAFLVVRLAPAAGSDLDAPGAPATYTGPQSIKPQGLSHVREIRELSDFEGQVAWVIGLDSKRPFTAASLTGPSRIYVDIG